MECNQSALHEAFFDRKVLGSPPCQPQQSSVPAGNSHIYECPPRSLPSVQPAFQTEERFPKMTFVQPQEEESGKKIAGQEKGGRDESKKANFQDIRHTLAFHSSLLITKYFSQVFMEQRTARTVVVHHAHKIARWSCTICGQAVEDTQGRTLSTTSSFIE